jgi:hypothetical protein
MLGHLLYVLLIQFFKLLNFTAQLAECSFSRALEGTLLVFFFGSLLARFWHAF